MVTDRFGGDDDAGSALTSLRHGWPPALSSETNGYRPLDLRATRPIGALELLDGGVVAVVAWPQSPPTALPCCRLPRGWRLAAAGDGLAARLVERLDDRSGLDPPGFRVSAFVEGPSAVGPERVLGADQSNISVVVGEAAIVKWRSAPGTDGWRAVRLRRHLEARRFRQTPPLLGSLSWQDPTGGSCVLAYVDAFLPSAQDGWDHAIDRLTEGLRDERGPDDSYASELGALVGQLHAALLGPSEFVDRPTRAAEASEMMVMREAARRLLERTLDIDAPDQASVVARAPAMRAAIDALPLDGTLLGPIHGDLHIGQLVAWRGGLAVIDLDGPPEPMAPGGGSDPPARDVAQMVCSLWNLAAAVAARSEASERARLRAWAARAERTFLDTYRLASSSAGGPPLDERLLEPFIVEQLCRELLYADAALPRWRYAPLQALCWRLAGEPTT